MKRKLLKSLLAIACLLSSTSVSAYDFEVDGICYDITSFTDLEVKATSVLEAISGEIVIPSEVAFNSKILKVIGIGKDFVSGNTNITKLTINSGATFIEDNAFKGCDNLSEVTIPSTITQIGLSVFENCTSLEVFKSDGVISAGASAFSGCVSLKNVSLNNLMQIEENTFLGCINLSDCEFMVINSIGKSAFKNCTSLVSFKIPNTVTSIGESAFESSGIVNLTIPNNVTELKFYAFRNCESLEYVSIGTGITYLSPAFGGCENLKVFRIEDSDTTIEFGYTGSRSNSGDNTGSSSDRIYYDNKPYPSMFSGYNIDEVYIGRNITTEIFAYNYSAEGPGWYEKTCYQYIPNPPFSESNVKKVILGPLVSDLYMYQYGSSGTGTWNGAFQGCTNLEEVENNSSATFIPTSMFEGCSNIKKIEFSSFVESIGSYALANCSNLEEISLGCNVSSLGSGALYGCTSLNKINLRNPNPPTYSSGFTSEEYIYTTICVPTGTISSYQESESWKNFWNIEESDELVSLFEVGGLKYMVISGTDVAIIGGNLLQMSLIINDQIEYNNIEYNVISISSGVFKNRSQLSTVTIKNGIKTIGDNCFEGCSNLKKITLPTNLISIGDNCFEGCSKLKDIELPSSLMSIGNDVFNGCDNLKSVIIENSDVPLTLGYQTELVIIDYTYPHPNPTTFEENRTGFRNGYYDGLFSGLPIERLVINRDIRLEKYYERTRGTATADYPLVYNDIVYYPPFITLPNLKSVEIGENVTAICKDTIKAVRSALPVTLIYSNFGECENVEVVVAKNPNAPIGGIFAQNVYDNGYLFLSNGGVESYKTNDYWKKFVNIREAEFVPIDSICFEDTKVIVDYNETKPLIVHIYPENASISSLKWKSSSNVINVDSAGIVTSSSREGKVIITATTTDGTNISATCIVEVVKGSGIESVFTSKQGENTIYTLDGVKRNATNISNLPEGIYIINGKKVMVK